MTQAAHLAAPPCLQLLSGSDEQYAGSCGRRGQGAREAALASPVFQALSGAALAPAGSGSRRAPGSPRARRYHRVH